MPKAAKPKAPPSEFPEQRKWNFMERPEVPPSNGQRYKTKMNQTMMNKVKGTTESDHLTKFSIGRRSRILLSHGCIFEAQYKRLRPIRTGTGPYMRERPKAHKPDIQSRSILHTQKPVDQKLAWWQVDSLDSIRSPDIPLRKTFQIANMMKYFVQASSKVLLINVDFLSTSVPFHIAHDSILSVH